VFDSRSLTVYPDRFPWFSAAPPDQYWDSTTRHFKAVSFHVISNSSYTIMVSREGFGRK
jgi:hypothetical protein